MMTKILLVAVVIVAAFFLARGLRRRVDDGREQPPRQGGGDMVRCARCGIHLPRDEALGSTESYFCSADHEREFQDNHRDRG
ncbi:MAG: PP0621 family protein [Burkholderiales bacterium]